MLNLSLLSPVTELMDFVLKSSVYVGDSSCKTGDKPSKYGDKLSFAGEILCSPEIPELFLSNAYAGFSIYANITQNTTLTLI